MKLYLAFESSLELIRYLRSTNGGIIEGATVSRHALRDAISTAHGIWGLDPSAELTLSHVSKPIHAFVGSQSRKRTVTTSNKTIVTHLYGSKLPKGSFIDIGHDICSSSPQFLFLQMATMLDTVDLIVLGMELCGHYSKWRLPPINKDAWMRLESEEQLGSTFDLARATSVSALRAFLERTKGAYGQTGARAAMRWLLDSSASPMETAVYLLLCLPKRLGGYGLPQPVLNPKVSVKSPEGNKARYPDLFWSAASIDVEYNSDLAHSGEWSRYRDSKREVELVSNDITVLPLTRRQVMDKDDFHAFAQGLRRLLGIRSRSPRKGWESKRDELRAKLLPTS